MKKMKSEKGEKTLIKTLHFTVGDGFTDLCRDIYWYEDKLRGYRLLDTMMGITIAQKDDVLNGDAYLKPIKGGTQMSLIYKQDKAFKKELAAHKKFLEEQELRKALDDKISIILTVEQAAEIEGEIAELRKKGVWFDGLGEFPNAYALVSYRTKELYHAPNKATKKQGKCGEECPYNPSGNGLCCFGYRHKGCYIETSYYGDEETKTVNFKHINKVALKDEDDEPNTFGVKAELEWCTPTPKRKAPKKAMATGGKCGEECKKYNPDGKCCFGLREKLGCWIETEGIERKFLEIVEFQKRKMMMGVKGLGEEGQLIDDMTVNKIFNFVYGGHEYVLGDNARNQGQCPRCNLQAPDNFWRIQDKGYIGCKVLVEPTDKTYKGITTKEGQYAYCFQCPKCHEHFFYHSTNPESFYKHEAT